MKLEALLCVLHLMSVEVVSESVGEAVCAKLAVERVAHGRRGEEQYLWPPVEEEVVDDLYDGRRLAAARAVRDEQAVRWEALRAAEVRDGLLSGRLRDESETAHRPAGGRGRAPGTAAAAAGGAAAGSTTAATTPTHETPTFRDMLLETS